MAVFKCKMCGGSLEVSEGMTVCECEYCGTKQTLPKSHDDVLTNNFNRANNLRMKSEFDKAQELYEKIVAANPTEAEAYWGIVLCKYGIEYVEDPATLKKIPTCHRTQYESVIADVDYKSAIENADAGQKELLEKEAIEIDKLQKNILEIVHKEKPFDVFICYKETDENGKRTPDSVIANDIYHQLTQEGFKVFYAAITLEDKLGQEYEPYIFAALNSAKVMLVIGTKPEYFNAVWVKNEWSRYLKLIKNDRSKLLIPCYKDMDAYDLPEEFSHLQAQDMSKIGFINDVIRGMKKVLIKDDSAKEAPKETVTITTSSNIENLLKRGNLALEDRFWNAANGFYSQVLNENVEEARAYLGLALSYYNVASYEELRNGYYDYTHNIYFQKAVRFARDDIKTIIDDLIKADNEKTVNLKQAGERLENRLSEISSQVETIEKNQNYYEQPKCEYDTRIAELEKETLDKDLKEKCFEIEQALTKLKNQKKECGLFQTKAKKELDVQIHEYEIKLESVQKEKDQRHSNRTSELRTLKEKRRIFYEKSKQKYESDRKAELENKKKEMESIVKELTANYELTIRFSPDLKNEIERKIRFLMFHYIKRINCPSCAATLSIRTGDTYVKCQFCGTIIDDGSV